ncbi:hypothetical protein A2866_05330 [Candidatus Roizmanbacteria bacterium RIFCSPHIGHO2_01_FULL_39_8]|uniref:Response regulatory domain-containing protein n=3 Tax=Candidatus Roizmaniibacteriota TaxID=1752723 RepID=A0A1F7GUR4_9BACT|nr:MAG: hypothetical protein A2866_05330 [Candidatus Roizmanbacteria bacterium RIFCSPHIGHO2_01_FULL_39_8]OGK25553.1 MAG: hypothetical protein A3C28_01710 [Candidatus Roizmanbacteria bacterium RIFCSPHIGHO2_02_FULL_39_9]OGK34934.1 MAG: hypothetical protein A3F60_04810 [Candidatus Roizmanbacteria bacterium RIFCSPHIGHO2_12_FULL_39_8]
MEEKILLVEDDPVLQKLYSDLLTSAGLHYETASDGETGYQKMSEGGWKLVLLDLMLPKMNGLDIVKKLKEDPPQNPLGKIVFLTNLEQGKEVGEIKGLGYEYVIKSDLDPNQFINKVKSSLI